MVTRKQQECAASKVLYYARLYSKRSLAENANYDNIINGWSDSINRMANNMPSCNKCGNVACESLAKTVAHRWLAAFGIFDYALPATPTGGSTSTGSKSSGTPAKTDDPWGCDAQWGHGSFLAGTCKWWNGAFGGIGESINKGGVAFGQLGATVGDPLAKYLPLMLLGFGVVALLMLFKGR